jgi:DNA replication and repair protein RecF
LISGGKEQVAIEYDSHLNEHDFAVKLEKAIERDRILEHTTVGIHKDELEFLITGYSLKKYASQGQQKSFLIALRLAQFDFIKSIKKTIPILLLDDIYDRLDDLRIKQLMKLVCSTNFGQLFITDTHPTRLANLFKESDVSFKIVNIANGKAIENTEEKRLEFR